MVETNNSSIISNHNPYKWQLHKSKIIELCQPIHHSNNNTLNNHLQHISNKCMANNNNPLNNSIHQTFLNQRVFNNQHNNHHHRHHCKINNNYISNNNNNKIYINNNHQCFNNLLINSLNNFNNHKFMVILNRK